MTISCANLFHYLSILAPTDQDDHLCSCCNVYLSNVLNKFIATKHPPFSKRELVKDINKLLNENIAYLNESYKRQGYYLFLDGIMLINMKKELDKIKQIPEEELDFRSHIIFEIINQMESNGISDLENSYLFVNEIDLIKQGIPIRIVYPEDLEV